MGGGGAVPPAVWPGGRPSGGWGHPRGLPAAGARGRRAPGGGSRSHCGCSSREPAVRCARAPCSRPPRGVGGQRVGLQQSAVLSACPTCLLACHMPQPAQASPGRAQVQLAVQAHAGPPCRPAVQVFVRRAPPLVGRLVETFSFLAVGTSFIGTTLSLSGGRLLVDCLHCEPARPAAAARPPEGHALQHRGLFIAATKHLPICPAFLNPAQRRCGRRCRRCCRKPPSS